MFSKGRRFRRFFSLAAVVIHKNHVTDKIIDYYKIIFCEINFRVNVEEHEEIGIFFFESF